MLRPTVGGVHITEAEESLRSFMPHVRFSAAWKLAMPRRYNVPYFAATLTTFGFRRNIREMIK
ncbi:hypothetical protein RAH42_12235 [Pyramidobacter sp. YE332]|uniref:hypothetical protein n=1 Tax=unclassified Pyramidobacter TaxID=2632171 RepID=UPI00143A57DA|nr:MULTISPECIES: hypothetical protein [unclassified Pyramidobacter]WOL39886.1 hypothetical protein RAH42_12235 [Pyramidobacter sp. YE332]